jgi:hypothetical protein
VLRSSESVRACYSWSLTAPGQSWCFGVLGELLEIVGASRKALCTRFETHRSGDGERVLLLST